MEDDRVRAPGQVEYGELPEVTRGLRALGSPRRSSGAFQSQFFMPLVEARKKAADARDPQACLRAFNPDELARAMERAIDRIVSGWPDTRASVRRALRAELTERVSNYLSALEVLSQRAAAALGANEESRLETWRAWTIQLAATFDAADRSWLAVRSAVDSLPTKPSGDRGQGTRDRG
ncbi:MAG TPA: hypothetical protein VFT29_11405 [Gemmatimonadaceae bacterium]|nr:hypothetical protein [Gemmatimonadaceae bacterium]